MTEAEWRPIARFRGTYEVSNDGRIRSLPRMVTCKNGKVKTLQGVLLKQRADKHGYLQCNLSVNAKAETIKVHAEVLAAFVGPKPDGLMGCHEDGDPSNNRVGNLRWGTSLSNTLDALRHGTKPIGSQVSYAILDEAAVVRIRNQQVWGRGDKQRLAQQFGVCKATISDVLSRKTWKHVNPAGAPQDPRP